ncbi:hypothetical protein JOB18_001756 [Solea senegalensis]|uniref:Uncharacterized protein n=1 Tax=Solea senegalensis TaxID=28829 RepID=A0AAV6Q6K5_SOLSE|nr:UPF0575 protein C19orf67 homolog [Solea senegalensis]KAG7485037.1 hypothetical protein JOB18_001756 [Solea senegalensis]
MLLADVALAPPCGDDKSCIRDCEVERSLQVLQLQLQFLMSKADDLQDLLGNRQEHVESFLLTCQPYFNHLQSTAWSSMSQHTQMPQNINTMLLDLSQQLCDKLEQLVLTYARHNLLCLDESEPNSVSHFCMGQILLSPLRVTVFRYCRLTPFLARVNTGLYKRMRWNVERLRDRQPRADEDRGGECKECEADKVGETEYYFLCCENIPNAHAEADSESQDICHDEVVKMWTIGQWVQMNPNPDTEDIYDWIKCEVPQARYQRLLFLGSEELPCCSATDLLQQLLLSQQSTE